MPVYTYRREDGTTFDLKQSFNDDPLKIDPHTGQAVTRVVQAAGVIFKGSGFYINDSKGGSRSSNLSTPKDNPATESKAADGAKSEAASASTDSASKPESKAETKPASKPATATPTPAAD